MCTPYSQHSNCWNRPGHTVPFFSPINSKHTLYRSCHTGTYIEGDTVGVADVQFVILHAARESFRVVTVAITIFVMSNAANKPQLENTESLQSSFSTGTTQGTVNRLLANRPPLLIKTFNNPRPSGTNILNCQCQ